MPELVVARGAFLLRLFAHVERTRGRAFQVAVFEIGRAEMTLEFIPNADVGATKIGLIQSSDGSDAALVVDARVPMSLHPSVAVHWR